MKLGDNIFKLRKDCKLSQEQLAEKVDVTRQTISNWELGETSPNPEQLKLLSKALNVSIDELLNNDIKQVLVEKVNNTEKLAKIIIKILKVLGIIFVVGFAITIFINIMFGAKKDSMTIKENQTVLLNCQLNSEKYTYLIEYDKDICKVRLLPEQNAECKFKYIKGSKLYAYCNKHGLWSCDVE